jgi:hypothetical protein
MIRTHTAANIASLGQACFWGTRCGFVPLSAHPTHWVSVSKAGVEPGAQLRYSRLLMHDSEHDLIRSHLGIFEEQVRK